MIPKIIHYCWLSDSPMSEKAQMCIESWKRYLPEYEFILWNFLRFPRGKCIWVDQAFNAGKFAFAADYIRLYAIYNYGGVYLDTDVEVLRSYNDLLALPYFIGQEKTPSGIEAATMGFPPKHPLIKQLLDRYEGRSFIKTDGKLDLEPLPYIIRRFIDAQYDYNVISRKEDYSNTPNVFNVFTADFFSPKRYDTEEIEITENTYSIHNFAGSWLPEKQKVSLFKRMKDYVVHHTLIRRNIVLVANTHSDLRLSSKFALKHLGPLSHAVVSYCDFEDLMKRNDLFVENNLHFINRADSKIEIGVNDFYPIAVVGDTSIEIHFTECCSREQALACWNQGAKNMNMFSQVSLYDYKNTTKLRDYWTCMKINFGCRTIR